MRRKSNRAENDFETQKEALLQEIRSVLGEVESLYEAGVERGEEEARELTAKLKQRLSNAQSKLQDFEERAVEQVKNSAKAADEYINEKPYYAMGFAALAGLVVGVNAFRLPLQAAFRNTTCVHADECRFFNHKRLPK